jgi:hypothetical protein
LFSQSQIFYFRSSRQQIRSALRSQSMLSFFDLSSVFSFRLAAFRGLVFGLATIVLAGLKVTAISECHPALVIVAYDQFRAIAREVANLAETRMHIWSHVVTCGKENKKQKRSFHGSTSPP